MAGKQTETDKIQKKNRSRLQQRKKLSTPGITIQGCVCISPVSCALYPKSKLRNYCVLNQQSRGRLRPRKTHEKYFGCEKLLRIHNLNHTLQCET